MWLLSLISFPILAISYIYFKIQKRWNGNPRNHADGSLYYFDEQSYKGELRWIRIGVEAPSNHYFEFKRERKVDRFLKWLGLCQEFQTGDTTFDQTVYITSDDFFVCDLLRQSASLRETIHELLSDPKHSLVCNGKLFWLHIKAPKQSLLPATRDNIAKQLQALSEKFKYLKNQPKTPDSYFLRGCIITGLNLTMATAGGISWLIFQEHMQNSKLFMDSVGFGLFLALIWLVFAIVMMRGSSRGNLVFLDTLLVGTFGVISTLYVVLFDLNSQLDTSEARHQIVTVTDKYTTRGRKGSVHYHVKTNHYADPTATYKLINSSSLYDKVQVGSHVDIVLREGYLGYLWVEDELAVSN